MIASPVVTSHHSKPQQLLSALSAFDTLPDNINCVRSKVEENTVLILGGEG